MAQIARGVLCHNGVASKSFPFKFKHFEDSLCFVRFEQRIFGFSLRSSSENMEQVSSNIGFIVLFQRAKLLVSGRLLLSPFLRY